MGITVSSVVPGTVEEVFAWHERPGALARMLPPWQPVRVGAEPTNLVDGAARLRLPGGLTWVAQHRDCDRPHRFVDELTSLPLPWRHEHEFAEAGDGLTRVTDTVRTPVPARLLRPMFDYRHRQLADDLRVGAAARARRPAPLTVAVTGASGLVGTELIALLGVCGYDVIRLVRHAPTGPHERRWDTDRPDPDLLAGVDVVVHLAGAPIAGRFSAAHKRAIRDSRVGPTRRLAAVAAAMADPPEAFVSASAIGGYGADRGDAELDEDATPGTGFLADVVTDWECDAEPAAAAGLRVVHVRTGIVQSPRGGALRLLRPLAWAGLAGRLGDGRQWFSWIDLDDLCDIYLAAVVDASVRGPVNATAPNPVRNDEYMATLRRVLRRPPAPPAPAFGPRLLLGTEGAREVALASQRVVPAALLAHGHPFRRPILEDCLRHQLGRFNR